MDLSPALAPCKTYTFKRRPTYSVYFSDIGKRLDGSDKFELYEEERLIAAIATSESEAVAKVIGEEHTYSLDQYRFRHHFRTLKFRDETGREVGYTERRTHFLGPDSYHVHSCWRAHPFDLLRLKRDERRALGAGVAYAWTMNGELQCRLRSGPYSFWEASDADKEMTGILECFAALRPIELLLLLRSFQLHITPR
ncbi:hypothetical protein [Flaviaesturariibacter amylovorans]|uniref:Uncharacterized protein n=1 Tax=Flaviaesturariibacter amylovorans TaxID=1084520 RepID=A0ABP8HUX6_9BACT